MAYVNYEYYVNEFNNGRAPVISEENFKYYEAKARRVIQMHTLKKSDDYTEDNAVKDCTCALADKYYYVDNVNKSDAGIASEKVGEYSVSYRIKTTEEIKKEVQDIIREYLGITGLLFKGASYVYKQ